MESLYDILVEFKFEMGREQPKCQNMDVSLVTNIS